jgi:hypothetical protein
MLISLFSILANIVYMIVLNIPFYTDRAMMPDGHYRVWHRSPVSRLYVADQLWLYYIQIALVAISVIASALVLFGVKSRTVRIVQIASIIASTAVFAVILIVTNNIHVHYA